MDENVVQISVRRRIAERSGGARAIVADNTEYTIQFLFDEEWCAYPTKTALFVRDDGLCYPPVVMEDGAECCKIPRINGTGHIRIGVTAGDITTTTPAEVRVLRSVLEAAGQVLDKPPAGVWADVLEKLGSTVKYTPESRTDEEKAVARENIGAISADEVPEPKQTDWTQNDADSASYIKNKPLKLSEFENDLYYNKRESFLTLTKEDFIVNEDIGIIYYKGSPKLEWLKSAENIGFSLTIVNPETNESETITDREILFDKIQGLGDGMIAMGNGVLAIFSGFNPFKRKTDSYYPAYKFNHDPTTFTDKW